MVTIMVKNSIKDDKRVCSKFQSDFLFISKILGWGKRHDALIDDEYDELPLYHPFVSQDNSARTWFDDT